MYVTRNYKRMISQEPRSGTDGQQQSGGAVTLAVLPFENLTLREDVSVFCRSFCFDLITELSRFRQFHVIAYQSIKEFQTDHRGLEVLETDYFIQGSFRSDNNTIRINAQLADSHSHRLVWANRFEAPAGDLMQLQDNLLREVVATLQEQLNYDLLSLIRKKPQVSLKAYEFWLYGMDELKKGKPENDEIARTYFSQAIETDPSFSLAYSGMSLTYFNEWSCQLWDRWEVNQNGAFMWAERAIELDEYNYIAALVLGRVFLYEGAYESAEYYLRRSLQLNNNDPDTLIQIVSCFTYLGYTEEAETLYQRVFRLNPLNTDRYHQVGIFLYTELGRYQEAYDLARRTSGFSWVDAPVFIAAVCFHLRKFEEMEKYWNDFMKAYREKISKTGSGTSEEALQWYIKVNPFRGKTNIKPFLDHKLKGTGELVINQPLPENNTSENVQLFMKEGELWKAEYGGTGVLLPEVKGFFDINKLLTEPGKAFHCAELMNSVLTEEGTPLLDDKAKKTYQRKILMLQEEIREAENHNDYETVIRLQKEYDQYLEHLSSALGLEGKSRRSGGSVEKARSAVTWRIRNAISKIEKEHPQLGKHLSNSIRTGTICTYSPEKPVHWET